MKSLKYILVISGISALAVWSLYLFFFLDLIGTQNNDINELKLETAFYEERHFEIKEMVGFLNEAKDQIEETERLFLPRKEQEIVSFIEKIEQLGLDVGVSLSMSNLSVDNRDSSTFLGVNIDIHGEWERVTEAVALLELMPYRVSIDRLDLRYGDNNWSSSLTLSVLMIE